MKLFASTWFLGAMCAAAVTVCDARDLDVSPDGEISTLEAARDEVRALHDQGVREPITVRIADGIYPLPQPIEFGPQDSGFPDAPVSYEAAPGAHPLFIGARQLTDWTVGPDGIWTTKVAPKFRFEALWVNGRRAVRARTPNLDANGLPTKLIFATGQPTQPLPGLPLANDAGHTLISLPPADVKPLEGLTPAELHEAQLVTYHSWDSVRDRLAGVRAADGTVQTAGARGFAFFQPEPTHRQGLFLENFRAALDAPGEWFLALDGTLSYIPRPGETPQGAEVFAPNSPQWLVLRGDAAQKTPVAYLRFRGLRFAYQNYTLAPNGAFYGQAENALGAAIEVYGASDLVFEDCEFAHTLTNALWVRLGSRNVTVRHCWMHDLGAGGVKIGDPDQDHAGPNQTEHVTVEDSIIHTGGRYFAAAIGVTIFQANDCAVRDCDIADFFYSGVSIGWVWGYKATSAGHNLVENCHIHHLGWGVLSDMAGVYTLGSQPGTRITGCRVHDIGVSHYGAFGLYNDEGSTGVVWTNNLVYRAQNSSFHQHYGRGNILRNNIFAFAKGYQLVRTRPEEFPAFQFENNLVVFNEGELLGPTASNWLDGRVALNRNLYWRTDGKPLAPQPGHSWAEWQSQGQDTESLVADPLFVDAAHDNFELQPNSPALRVGFVPFDTMQAGVKGGADWKKLAAEPFPAMNFPPPELTVPLQLDLDFDTLPVGSKPALLQFYEGGKDGAIQVVAEGSQAGGRSLQVQDGPDAHPSWNPHFFFLPHHTRGTTTITFKIKLDAKMHLLSDWRDSDKDYRSGPLLDFNQGVLFVNGAKLTDYPINQWLKVEVSAALGASGDGTYTLALTPAGGKTQRFDRVKFASPDFQQLQWFGFVAPNEDVATAWIEELTIHNKE